MLVEGNLFNLFIFAFGQAEAPERAEMENK